MADDVKRWVASSEQERSITADTAMASEGLHFDPNKIRLRS